jgi:protein phosphatase-4 regulatory subunit 3
VLLLLLPRHQDAFYAHQLVKNNLMEPVMAAFFANGPRYNLLNSAVLELVELITTNNVKVIGRRRQLDKSH